MFYACFTPIALCFAYTLWYFYAFSRTNLLIRCHNVSSVFSAIFMFQKVTQEIFSELDETKPKVSIFPDTTRSPKGRRRGARRQPHLVVVRVHPWARHPMVWGPWVSSDIAPLPIKSLRRNNLRSIGVFPEKVPQRRRHRRPILGDRSLCSGTLSGRRIAPGAISIDSPPSPSTPPPSPSTLMSPMMRSE
jgi:hypothetical protein